MMKWRYSGENESVFFFFTCSVIIIIIIICMDGVCLHQTFDGAV